MGLLHAFAGIISVLGDVLLLLRWERPHKSYSWLG
jgi:hypothetical protein